MGAEERVRVTHVDDAFTGVMVLDTQGATVLAGIAGQKVSDNLFALIRRLHLGPIVVLLQQLGYAMSLLALCEVLPKSAVWGVVMVFPALLQQALFMNRGLLGALITNFETWYLFVLVLAWSGTMADVFSYDDRMIFVVGVAWGVLTIIFADALHPSVAKLNVLATTGAILMLLGLACLAHFGEFKDMNTRTMAVGKMLGLSDNDSLTVNNVLFANQRLLIITVFLIKNVVTWIRHPGCYVVLKARIKQEKMAVSAIRNLLPPGHDLAVIPKASGMRKRSSGANKVNPAERIQSMPIPGVAKPSETAVLRARVAELEKQLAAARAQQED